MSFEDDSYKKALEQVEYVDSVQVGFSKTTGFTPGDLSRKAIQQNNTIIQQIINLNQKVDSLVAEVKTLRTQKVSQSSEPLPEDLIKRLEKLSLGEKAKTPEKKGVFYAFKDPYVILEEERAKLKNKKNEQ